MRTVPTTTAAGSLEKRIDQLEKYLERQRALSAILSDSPMLRAISDGIVADVERRLLQLRRENTIAT